MMRLAAEPQATHVLSTWKYASPLISARFDRQGRFLISCAEDSSVQRWDTATGKSVVMKGHQSWARGIAFPAGDETVVTSGYDDHLIWWPLVGEDPKPIRRVKAHQGWIRTLAASPDGKMLASAGNDLIVRIWESDSGKLIRELDGHKKHVYSSLFHPSGESLLTGDLAGQVHQWDLATGSRARTFDAKALHTYNGGQKVDYGGVRSLSLSADCKSLACGGLHKATNPLGAVNEPLVMMFDWDSQKLLKSHVAKGVRGIAWRTMFHPDGFLISAIGGSGGGHLVFWKTDQEKALHKLKLKNTAREFDLHPDGIRLATVHHDRCVRICKMQKKA